MGVEDEYQEAKQAVDRKFAESDAVPEPEPEPALGSSSTDNENDSESKEGSSTVATVPSSEPEASDSFVAKFSAQPEMLVTSLGSQLSFLFERGAASATALTATQVNEDSETKAENVASASETDACTNSDQTETGCDHAHRNEDLQDL